MRHVRLFFVLATLTLFPPTLATGDVTVCPTSSMQFGCSALTNAAQYDSTCGTPGFTGTVRVHFDLAQRTLGMDATTPVSFFSPSGSMRVAEIYRLVGGTPGTPVTFNIRMPVAATLYVPFFDDNGRAAAGASLEVDGVVVAQASESYACSFSNCTTTGSLSAPLLAQVTIPVGQDFVLVAGLTASVRISGSNSGQARAEANFQFEGLPLGTSVVSCHDGLTPALRSTWGDVKVRYR